ncbi:hypothetical protein [Nocardia sp. NPDC020380]|uniref:hypothetical protein n=1 Tax=Nocardia sp. NPDC020380 TaxID=3364309 RepID=UPI0037A27C6F
MDPLPTPRKAFRSIMQPLAASRIVAMALLVFVIAGQLRMRRRSDDRAATS